MKIAGGAWIQPKDMGHPGGAPGTMSMWGKYFKLLYLIYQHVKSEANGKQ